MKVRKLNVVTFLTKFTESRRCKPSNDYEIPIHYPKIFTHTCTRVKSFTMDILFLFWFIFTPHYTYSVSSLLFRIYKKTYIEDSSHFKPSGKKFILNLRANFLDIQIINENDTLLVDVMYVIRTSKKSIQLPNRSYVYLKSRRIVRTKITGSSSLLSLNSVQKGYRLRFSRVSSLTLFTTKNFGFDPWPRDNEVGCKVTGFV